MCGYSLHAVATRAAEVGEKLVSTKFRLTPTRGFAGIDSPDVAVCLRPGCACRKLNPGMLVMHSAQDWATKNVRAARDRLGVTGA
jgi:hypothetical protein